MHIGSRIGIPTRPLGAGGAAAAWAPTNITGLHSWHRADLGVTLNGSDVSAWADQSGNGHDFSQGSASLQPAFTSSNASYNSHPTIDSDGGNRLDSDSAASAWKLLHDGTGCTIAIVWRASVNGGRLLDTAKGSAGNAGILFRVLTSGGGVAFAKENAGAWLFTFSTAESLNTTCLSLIRHGQGESPEGEYRHNGSSVETEVYADPASTSDPEGTLSLFGLSGGGQNLTGSIAEVVVYDSYLSGTDLSDLETYLTERYGLS